MPTETVPYIEDSAATIDVIGTRLMKAQEALPFIIKDAQNSHAGYKYPKADSYIASCRSALLDSGLVMRRTFWFNREDMTVNIHFAIIAPDCGVSQDDGPIVCPVVARKGMPEDKAMFAALTSSTSYYLQGLFMLPRLDSAPEVDQINDTEFVPTEEDERDLWVAIKELAELVGMDTDKVTSMVTTRANETGERITAAFVRSLIDTAKAKKGN